ncbi:hypothetical protein IWQ56_002087 [Coemansia nantahalensis]|nr:hypothetical protein IWQ56_002087 [Coemansia nantahalensis]
MSRYPPTLVAGACIGGAVLAVVAVSLAVLCVRRWSRRRSQVKAAAHEEALAASAHAAGAATRSLAARDETQPLLDESAIRTRYVGSPNEYARSLLERCSSNECAAPHSLAWRASNSIHSVTENVVDIVATDSSSSSDSEEDSGSDAPETTVREQDSSPHSPQRTRGGIAEALERSAGATVDSGNAASLELLRDGATTPPRAPGLNLHAKPFVPTARTKAAARAPGEPAAAAAAATAAGKVAKRRCRFWPTCSNGKCKYAHPQRACRAYPDCEFGASCIFVHPSDEERIHAFLAGKGPRTAKRKNDIIKFNRLESFKN